MDAQAKAAANRSIRAIKNELEFLADTSLLSQSQLSSILALLPNPSTAALNPEPPTAASVSEKQPSHHQSDPSPAPPPPAYNASTPSIASATALYAYTPTDAGDLALLPVDRIAITEYMNADWAKGRNERTGQEGIFPRSYVSIVEDAKSGFGAPPPPALQSGYGNVPLAVSQSGGGASGGSKFDDNGKKFGKKLGNAALFGAGATLGGKLVNGIF